MQHDQRHLRSLILIRQYKADSIKVALGIGHYALGSYCLVLTQVNDCLVAYAQMPNAQLLMINYRSNLS